MKQDSLDLYADKPFFKPLPPLPRKLSIPARRIAGERKKLFVHWAFDRIHLYPPPRKRVSQEPQQVDERFFIMSRLTPYPEWPLICKLAMLPAFKTEEELKKWTEFFHGPTLLKWRCRLCKHIHQWAAAGTVTDTNGNFSAGADEAPSFIVREFVHPDNEKIFWFRHKLS